MSYWLTFVVYVGYVTQVVICDYQCLCNYNIEKSVYSDADVSSDPIGYLYEFDCRYLINVLDDKWALVVFDRQVSNHFFLFVNISCKLLTFFKILAIPVTTTSNFTIVSDPDFSKQHYNDSANRNVT